MKTPLQLLPAHQPLSQAGEGCRQLPLPSLGALQAALVLTPFLYKMQPWWSSLHSPSPWLSCDISTRALCNLTNFPEQLCVAFISCQLLYMTQAHTSVPDRPKGTVVLFMGGFHASQLQDLAAISQKYLQAAFN